MFESESVPTSEKIPFWTAKRIVLAQTLGFTIVTSVLTVGLIRFPAVSGAMTIISSLGWGVCMLAWIKADSREVGYELDRRFPLVVVLLGVFALAYYLFRSRGFARGLAAAGLAVLFGLLTLATSLIAGAFALIIMVLIAGPNVLKGL